MVLGGATAAAAPFLGPWALKFCGMRMSRLTGKTAAWLASTGVWDLTRGGSVGVVGITGMGTPADGGTARAPTWGTPSPSWGTGAAGTGAGAAGPRDTIDSAFICDAQ